MEYFISCDFTLASNMIFILTLKEKRESYMSANVLLNLSNELRKSDKCED